MNTSLLVTRRGFVKTTTTAAVAAASGFSEIETLASAVQIPHTKTSSHGLIDTNITLGRWPFRQLPLDETPALLAKLRQRGVTQAWAGSFEGLFHKDLSAANARLAEACQRQGRGLLVPFGSVNPSLPGWEDDVHRCAEVHKMPGIRLHPSYHGYKLDDPAFAQLLLLAGERRLIIQIVADMEDERTQHPLARAPHADFKPLLAKAKALRGARIILLNWFRSINPPLVEQLATSGACFDIATLEGVGGVANLIEQIPASQVVFGSHTPLFYFESALLKLKESLLTTGQEHAVRFGNARRLLSLTQAKG